MKRRLFPTPAAMLSLLQGALLLFLSVDLLLHDSIPEIFKEGHAIEVMSALYFLVAAVLLLALRDDDQVRRHWHLPVILILMALREFDLDKRLTTEGVLQLRLYSGPSPLLEKLAGAAVVLLILICGWLLLVRTVPRWWAGLRSNLAESWLSLGAAAAIIVAKALDGIDRKLAPLGIGIDPRFVGIFGRIEEMLEVIAATMLVMAVSFFGRRRIAWGADAPVITGRDGLRGRSHAGPA